MFLLFTAKFRDIGKHEKAYMTYHFVIETASGFCWFPCSLLCKLQTLGNKNELLQMAYLIYQFPNGTVSGKVSFSCYLLCSANSLYNAQQKVVTWTDMPDNTILDLDCQVFRILPLLRKLLRHWARERSEMTRHIWHIIFWMRLCQAFVPFPVVYCANFWDIRYQKSINNKKVKTDVSILDWDCVRYLIMFLLFTAKFIDIWKHEKVTWKGVSDLSFRDWDCVRFLFIFLLSTVRTSQTLGNKNELLQMAYLIYQFPNGTVSGKVSFSCYLLCSANSLYNAQQKVVTWTDMPDNTILDLDCQVFRILPLLRKLLRHWARERSEMTRHIWHIIFWMRLCQAFVPFPVVYCANFWDIRYQKSINNKKVKTDVSILDWDCVRYLIMFLLFTAKFIDIWKHEKVTWKGVSDLSFRDWDCVRFLFIFLLSTVRTSQTLGNKNELLQMAYLIYQFPNETVSGKVSISCYFLCSGNSLYIVQQKVVPWKDMLRRTNFWLRLSSIRSSFFP